jgi:hypothetical protein
MGTIMGEIIVNAKKFCDTMSLALHGFDRVDKITLAYKNGWLFVNDKKMRAFSDYHENFSIGVYKENVEIIKEITGKYFAKIYVDHHARLIDFTVNHRVIRAWFVDMGE